jgi:hypothetical protein
MTFVCPKCGRYGMEWDGRAKVLVCYYNTCNHVIPVESHNAVPTAREIQHAIAEDHPACDKSPSECVSADDAA